MLFRIALWLIPTVSLVGCVPSEVIVMKNPNTGEIVRCEKNSGASFFPIAQTMMDNSAARSCAQGYQAAGWQRMN
jgi:hypothetical protein